MKKYLIVFKGGTAPKTKLEKCVSSFLKIHDRLKYADGEQFELFKSVIINNIEKLNTEIPSNKPLRLGMWFDNLDYMIYIDRGENFHVHLTCYNFIDLDSNIEI